MPKHLHRLHDQVVSVPQPYPPPPQKVYVHGPRNFLHVFSVAAGDRGWGLETNDQERVGIHASD